MMNKSEWKKVKLEEICDILDSKRIPITASERVKGTYPYYGANGIQDYINDYIFDDELVLLAEDGGNFGSKTKPIAYRVSGKCWVNNHAHVLKAKENLITPDFLCYSLMFYDVTKIINGATRLKLTQSAMRNMLIYLPSLEEQKKIVKKIKYVVQILNKRKEQFSEFEKLVKFQFLKMFDMGSNDMKHIGDIANICRGASPRPISKYVTNENDGVNWIKIGDVSEKDIYITHTSEKITKDGAKKSRAVEPGDFILSNSMSFGRPYLVGINGCVHDGWLIISGYQEYLDPLFFYYELRSDLVQRQFNGSANGSCVKNLNSDLVKKVKIYVPPKEQQILFADFVKKVDKSKVEKFFDFKKAVA